MALNLLGKDYPIPGIIVMPKADLELAELGKEDQGLRAALIDQNSSNKQKGS